MISAWLALTNHRCMLIVIIYRAACCPQVALIAHDMTEIHAEGQIRTYHPGGCEHPSLELLRRAALAGKMSFVSL